MNTFKVSFFGNFYPHIKKRAVGVLDELPMTEKFEISRLIFSFDVKVEYQETFEWRIRRTYEDFKALHIRLQREVQSGNMINLPILPSGSQFLDTSEDEQLELLETYLKGLTEPRDTVQNPVFLEFLEVSPMSFEGVTQKRKEGYVLKRTGGRIVNEMKCCNCTKYFRRMQKRWLVIRDNMVGYMSNNTRSNMHEVLMFRGRFEVTFGLKETGYEDGIRIVTLRRDFIFRAGSVLKRDEWVEAIQVALEESQWSNAKLRYESSFPVRANNHVRWFVDAKEYFNEVYEALKRTKKEVFITDWWLSPELYLKRPASKFKKAQVVEVLGELADREVSVYIVLYKEFSLALMLNSLHSKNSLEKRNKNIRVLRHPHRSVVGGEFLWSHHGKMVCIDQETVFLGGLDLCYGRMDSFEHKLTDCGEVQTFNGIDYSNVRICDFADVSNYQRDSIDRMSEPRMPWHDIALKATGKVASDAALHFIELWNHVMSDITSGNYRNKDLILPKSSFQKETKAIRTILEEDSDSLTEDEESQEEEKFNIQVTQPPQESKPQMNFLQVQRSNSHVGGFRRALTQMRENTRRRTRSFASAARRINVEALQRNIETDDNQETTAIRVKEKSKFSEVFSKFLGTNPESASKAFAEAMRPDDQNSAALRKRSVVQNIDMESHIRIKEKMEQEEEEQLQREMQESFNEGDEAWARNLPMPKMKELGDTGSCECQIIRSAGLWSFGLDSPEISVHKAYLELIDQADHFIYIENQFFISGVAGSPVKNAIAQALVDRIIVAAERKEKFKVIVVLPLLPAFEGSVDDPKATILRVQLHWEYQTICRGPNSLYEQLKKSPYIEDPFEYISFYGLRNHDLLNGKPVTEIVYVHSKLMIVDDDIAIIGSANINDRSQLGKNDSEIAMVVNDSNKLSTTMGGEPRMVSKFAHTLRKQLFKEFLGTSDDQLVSDPLSEEFTRRWKETAKENTNAYRHIFRVYPDDHISRVGDITTFEQEACPEDYLKLKNTLKGFLVEFPLDFLKHEDLRLKVFNYEYYIPEVSFV